MRPLFILTQPQHFDRGDVVRVRRASNGLALGLYKSAADGTKTPLVGYFYTGIDAGRPACRLCVEGVEVAADFSYHKPGSIVDRIV